MNASPLIGLAHLDELAWLRKLYGRALITPTVRSEVLTGLGRPGEAEVSAAIRRRQISVLRRDPRSPLLPALDDGEASTIRAALAYGPAALVILDELSAHKAARRLGLHCTGTAGVIVEARRAAPCRGTATFQAISGMWISSFSRSRRGDPRGSRGGLTPRTLRQTTHDGSAGLRTAP